MKSNRISELAKHTGFYGLGTIAGGLARIALVPIIGRFLPADEYGKASVVLIFMNLLGIISELGLGSSLIRFFNEASDEKERNQVTSTVFVFSLAAVVSLTGLCIAFSPTISMLLLGSSTWQYLVIVGAIGGGGSALLQIGLSFERARAQSLRYTLYTIAKGVFALGLSVVLLVYLRIGAVGLLVGSAIPPAAIGLVIYWRKIADFGRKVSGRLLKSILDFGLPLVPVSLAMWVLSYSDIYLLRKLLPADRALSEVGLYQYAHEICLLLVLPITAFNLAWPQFIFSNHKRPEAKQIFSDAHSHFTLILIEIGLVVGLFSNRIVDLVGGKAYEGSIEVIPLLAGSLIFYGLSIVFSSGLYISGKTSRLGIVVTCCAALNVVLNIGLIPSWGKIGAAVATLITDMVMAFSVLILANRTYPIPFRVMRTVLALGLAAISVIWSSLYFNIRGGDLIRLAILIALTWLLPSIFSTNWRDVVVIMAGLKRDKSLT